MYRKTPESRSGMALVRLGDRVRRVRMSRPTNSGQGPGHLRDSLNPAFATAEGVFEGVAGIGSVPWPGVLGSEAFPAGGGKASTPRLGETRLGDGERDKRVPCLRPAGQDFVR